MHVSEIYKQKEKLNKRVHNKSSLTTIATTAQVSNRPHATHWHFFYFTGNGTTLLALYLTWPVQCVHHNILPNAIIGAVGTWYTQTQTPLAVGYAFWLIIMFFVPLKKFTFFQTPVCQPSILAILFEFKAIAFTIIFILTLTKYSISWVPVVSNVQASFNGTRVAWAILPPNNAWWVINDDAY